VHAHATESSGGVDAAADGSSASGGIIVEGPAFETRAAAARHAQRVRQDGRRVQVERRYAHGHGWRWHVVLDVADVETADGVAAELTTLTGQPHTVLAPARPSARPVLPPATLLLSARQANGPVDGLERIAASPDLQFRYVRRLPDGRSLRHVYVRHGQDVAVSVQDVDTGNMVVQVRVQDGRAERAHGDRWVPADLHRVRDLASQLAPEQVLRAALVLPQALVERRELVLARPDGQDQHGYRYTYVPDGDGRSAAELHLDPHTGRVTRLSLRSRDGLLVRELSGLAPDAVVPVPQRLRTTLEGALVDDVEVEVLALETPPSAHGLTEPGT